MTSNRVFENCQLEKSHWKINHIVTTEYIILASNQHSIFIFYYFNAKLLGKYSQTPVWQLCDSCQILDLINFQSNLTWPNSNTAGISLDLSPGSGQTSLDLGSMSRYSAQILICILNHKEYISVKFHLNPKVFIQGNSLENVVYEMAAIFARCQCVYCYPFIHSSIYWIPVVSYDFHPCHLTPACCGMWYWRLY